MVAGTTVAETRFSLSSSHQELKGGEGLRGLGWFITSAGVLWLLFTASMSTSVATPYRDRALGAPAEVHNLDLAARKQHHFILSGVCVVGRLLLVGIGSTQRHPVRSKPRVVNRAMPGRTRRAAYILGGFLLAAVLTFLLRGWLPIWSGSAVGI
jgi:hypothetical protein